MENTECYAVCLDLLICYIALYIKRVVFNEKYKYYLEHMFYDFFFKLVLCLVLCICQLLSSAISIRISELFVIEMNNSSCFIF